MTVLMAGKAMALTVNDVRIGMHPDKTRMVLDLSEASKFRVFTLQDPYRLVIDMPDFAWNVGNISKPAASAVTAIRQGDLKPGFSRIVVDLTKPVAVSDAFILRKNNGLPDRLVIDFRQVSTSTFARQKGKVLGILDVDSPAEETVTASYTSNRQDRAASYTQTYTPQEPAPAATAKPPTTTMVVPAVKPQIETVVASSGAMVPETKPEFETPAPRIDRKPLIIIDPGHGGVDPGAIGANGVFEKHVTLSMAKELQTQLERSGRYRVMVTRRSDNYLKLYQRVDIARQNNADLFVSLHADSIDKSGVRGASIYTLSEKASDSQTAKLAERENKADIIAGADLSHEDKQVADILISLAMRDTMNQSKFLANTMVSSLNKSGIRLLDNAHRYAGFAVLKAPDVPSILIEMGFMSNRSEAQLLTQNEYRRKMASAIKSGIDDYFEKVSRNNRI
ncbi:MAG: N-acetylmuramoyl-L-alanine amidase [Pseudomonadota bacterium]|nr:N-acetylmuramoyl-L-alanine amidase [Pseudomonadota bacterium]MEC8665332.1 N-acetylmuramoyl-L-alanine amidase [Pseudomonadota bacterium]